MRDPFLIFKAHIRVPGTGFISRQIHVSREGDAVALVGSDEYPLGKATGVVAKEERRTWKYSHPEWGASMFHWGLLPPEWVTRIEETPEEKAAQLEKDAAWEAQNHARQAVYAAQQKAAREAQEMSRAGWLAKFPWLSLVNEMYDNPRATIKAIRSQGGKAPAWDRRSRIGGCVQFLEAVNRIVKGQKVLVPNPRSPEGRAYRALGLMQ